VFDYDKRRPLHVAAADGHLEPVKVLLSAKAEVNALDRWQCTPLTEAMRGGFDEICELLVACGGRVDGMTREEQRSFLWLAIDNQDKDDPEALRLARLLSCGIDVNCIDLEGMLRRPAIVALLPDLANFVSYERMSNRADRAAFRSHSRKHGVCSDAVGGRNRSRPR